jgi:C-5 cytosine-specific DNA methylase
MSGLIVQEGGKPLAIDLFCGDGGWAKGFLAAGYRVVGYDIAPECRLTYPGEFIEADVAELHGSQFSDATAIVASPPCTEFSDMRFLRPNPKPPNMKLVEAAFRIRRESGVNTVIENVRGARKFFPERCKTHRGAYYLWGDVPLIAWNGKVPMKIGAVAQYRDRNGNLTHPKSRQWGQKAIDKSQKGAR